MMDKIIRWFLCNMFLHHEYELKIHSFGAYDQEIWEQCKHCPHQGRSF